MEEDCILAALNGDQQAITELVQTYQRSVFGLCYRMLGNSTDAEEAAQDALVKAIMNLQTFEVGRPFKPWVLRIAANLCTDRLRRRKPVVSLDAMGDDGAWEWQAGADISPEAHMEHRERNQQIRDLLDTLGPLDRSIVTMFYWQDLSYEEIAQATDLTLSAVKSRLFRARRAMAENLRQQQEHTVGMEVKEVTYVGRA
ncbi:MAG: sigma-70 family RNA polymerase sigma factor [Anaerolineae bacterium]|nr:sigma-70 family RNA polymerase sigma factor [Anaerolineae bacterium]